VTGTGGSLRDPKGNPITSYSWGLSNVSNNIVEAYALWEGVKIVRERRITKDYYPW
jgi:hypothetical protein